MDTIGWLLLFSGAFLIRGVINGRGFKSFTDLGDAFLAAAEFNSTKLKAAWDETGSNNDPDTSATDAVTVPTGTITSGFSNGVSLLAEMQRIGTGKGYSQVKRTGPDSFDCSGLVWKAGSNLGIWPKGTTAFNTASFVTHTKAFGLVEYTDATAGGIQAGDIIWWVGHMGVATDSQNFFSALSSHTKPPIGTVPISAVDKEHGTHHIFRFIANTGSPGALPGAGGGGGGGSF